MSSVIQSANLKPGFNNYFSQVHGSSLALNIAKAANEYEGLLMVLLPDAANTFPLKSEIEYFLNIDGNTEQEVPVFTLPDWETLPYDYFSPHQDIISERLETLYKLPRLKKGVLLLPVSSALQKLPTRKYIEQQCLLLQLGQTIQIESLRHRLSNSGYSCVANVMEHGEFAIRGSIIDLFPMGVNQPIRIELFDDEVESLRFFDAETQLTTDKVDSINLLPAKEYPTDENAIATFRQNWRASFDSNIKESSMYRDVSNGIFPAGIEYYLPLFFEELSTIFDFIDQSNLLVVHTEKFSDAIDSFWSELNERYEQYRHDIERPIVAPLALYLNKNQLEHSLNQYAKICLSKKSINSQHNVELNYHPCPKVQVEHKANDPLTNFRAATANFSKVLVCAESIGRQEVLRELFAKHKIPLTPVDSWQTFISTGNEVALTTAPPRQGFASEDWLLVCESNLFGSQVLQSRRRQDKGVSPDQLIHSLAELKPGDPVVHVDQGVGRYLGLQSIAAGGITSEFLTLEYN
ncbi:MAG: transcription-repair coupling factor, partial [Kangiellaceae bacterium]|nr:transcription-repair coupling factor [Kangiellaceae bacterium]